MLLLRLACCAPQASCSRQASLCLSDLKHKPQAGMQAAADPARALIARLPPKLREAMLHQAFAVWRPDDRALISL